jgi:predicted metal-dependent phosphoesterase TrpH
MYPPRTVVEFAKQRGIAWLAITDHDTLAGNAEAIQAGEAFGVRVTPGVEISSLAPAGEVHVLGYGVVPTDDKTHATLASLRDIRDARARGILAKLDTLGIHIPFARVQALAGDGMIGRPHVARALIEQRIVQNQQEAFDKYLSEGKPGFVRHVGLTPVQAVELIHAAHGVAVLAHPWFFRGELLPLIQELCAVGLDGIETYYPSHTAEQVIQLEHITDQFGLIRTGGSDFHGIYGDYEMSLGSMHVPDACLTALDAALQRRQCSS